MRVSLMADALFILPLQIASRSRRYSIRQDLSSSRDSVLFTGGRYHLSNIHVLPAQKESNGRYVVETIDIHYCYRLIDNFILS